jgi:formylglycine-generating enzyme
MKSKLRVVAELAVVAFVLAATAANGQNGDPPSSVTPGTGTWVWANQNGDFTGSYSISSGTEVDVYAFMADQTGSYVISTGGSLDSQLRIYNSSGTAITAIIDSTGGGETTTASFASGSWYYIAVTGYQLNTGNYTLSVNGPDLPRASIATPAPNYNGVASGYAIDYGGDLDYFQITAPSGTTSLDLIIGPTGLNTYGELYNSSGTLLTSFNTGGSGVVDVLNSYPVTSGATYYVGVSGISRTVTGSFILSVDFNPDQVIPTGFGGAVTDSFTGNPIAGASVSWNGYSTTTAADGGYSLNNLPCATATLTVSKSGYTTSSQSYTPTCNASSLKNVQLAPNVTEILGTVVDSVTANPISGATVTWNGNSTTTGVNGSYILNNLACATATLTVSKSGYVTYSEGYTPACPASNLKNVSLTAIPLPMTIAGNVRYLDSDLVARNAAYIHVEAREKETLIDYTIAEGYTDTNGNFAFTTDTQGNLIYNVDTGFGESGTRDIYFKIRAENEAAKVYEWLGGNNGIVYEFDSDTQYDVGGTSYSTNFYFTSTGPTPNHAAAFGIPGSIKVVKDWLFQRTGWTRPQVSVLYPYSSGPQYDPNNDSIEIKDAPIPRGALEHEYGHAVQYYARGGNMPVGTGPDPHSINSVASEGFALREGWGDFFMSAVLNDPGIFFPGLEANNYWMGPNVDGTDHLGNLVEGATASIFWDILDAANDDQVNNRFLDLWTVFLNDDPNSIWNSSGTSDFYHDWNAHFGETRAVDEIFIDQGIPVTDDGYENNDVPASAPLLTNLRATYANLILADSADWYKFIISERPATGSAVTINFVNQHGNLDLELYDDNSTLVGSSASSSDSETIDLAGRAAGTYYVRVFGYKGDFSPNYSLTMAILPDVSGPALTITSHTSGQTVSSGIITLSGTASDSGRGGNGISTVTINGVRANNDTTTGSGTANWYANVVLSQGANTITVVARDASVNQNPTTQTIVITYIPPDTTAPAVAITFPANNATVTSPSLTVTGTASDSGLGNNGVSSVTVNGVSASNGTASGANTAYWSATISLNPGVNTITAVAKDTFNNSGQQQITVTYNPPDTTAPAVAITFPANNATVTSPSLTVTGTASDSGLGNSGVSSVTVNGVSASNGTASGANTAYWSATISLNPGVNTITAVARDTFNNAGQQQITVTYNPPDTTAPAVAINFPANNATVTSASLTVTGTASDSGLGNNGVSSVTVNGVSASSGTASGANTAYWSATITLNPGVNTITAVGKDTFNNSGQQQITITYNPPPQTAKQLTEMALSNGVFRFMLNGPVGSNYVIQISSNLVNWLPLVTNVIPASGSVLITNPAAGQVRRFYRAVGGNTSVAPTNMALIPAGSFQMGDSFLDGDSFALPLHTVYVSAIYMDKYEVTKALWDDVKGWNGGNGYVYDNPGLGKAPSHPVQTVSWYDVVKWCNARSQKEGRTPAYYTDAALTQVYKTGQVAPYVNWSSGYRLPTEAEWEKAARGGLSGQRFPWGNTISESQANYSGATASYSYDLGPNGYNATFAAGGYPYTSPVGYFAANGYGLYDMAGNVWEWCWDWSGAYSSGSQTDPRGPATGSDRVDRGGGWDYYAINCRAAYRDYLDPTIRGIIIGFRSVLPPGQ